MSNASDCVIENGVLVAYNGSDSHMAIPEGVTAIAPKLLEGKSHVTSVTIPSSVTEIGVEAFCGKWGWDSYPACFTIYLSDLDAFLRMKHFYFMPLCNRRFVVNGQVLEELTIPGTMTEVGHLFSRCEDLKKVVISEGVEQIALEAFTRCRNLTHVCLPKSLKTVENDAFSGCPLTRLELAEGASFKMGRIFGYTFPAGLAQQTDELSRLMDAEGIKNYIIPDRWKYLSEDSKARIFLTYQDAKMKKQYKKLLKPAELDPLSEAILRRLGPKLTKKECGIVADFMLDYLACLSGPCLKVLYDAIAAQKKTGADAIKALDANAGVKKKMAAAPAAKVDRGPRTKNDVAFDNMGFDDTGVKVYDLGTKQAHAVIQPDFTVLIRDPVTGKISKSVPKKGSDISLYTAAAEDFKALGKAIKALVVTCRDSLYNLYLSAEELPANTWKAEWTGNPITRGLASMVVWQQGDCFFTLEGAQTVTVDGVSHALTDAPVRVACTADMENETVTAWQHRFAARKQKQPFLQIWEPVRKLDDIREDRYADRTIRSGYLRNQKTLGIQVFFYAEDWGEDPNHCNLTLANFDIEQEEKLDGLALEITRIRPLKWDRRSNAIISFLDRVCIYDRIHNDDVTIAESLDQFTLEQITDFLSMAVKHSLPNVTALLLDYKNTHFAAFDPMEEFLLE